MRIIQLSQPADKIHHFFFSPMKAKSAHFLALMYSEIGSTCMALKWLQESFSYLRACCSITLSYDNYRLFHHFPVCLFHSFACVGVTGHHVTQKVAVNLKSTDDGRPLMVNTMM